MKMRIVFVSMAIFFLLCGSSTPKSDAYNPHRADGTLKTCAIRVDWDNPDVAPENLETMRKNNAIAISVSADGIKLTKGERAAELSQADYLELWKLMEKVDMWKLESNALTDPRPIGVSQRVFSILIEGRAEKLFNVDVPNKKSEKHFILINAIDALCTKHAFP